MTECTSVTVPRYPPPANSDGYAFGTLCVQPKWLEPPLAFGWNLVHFIRTDGASTPACEQDVTLSRYAKALA